MSEWISVDDRLPERLVDVLLCYGDGSIVIDCWFDGLGGFLLEDFHGKVTHWMPLPAAPGKESQKTNADRIRAMSDKELANWLVYFNSCEHCTYEGRCTSKCIGGVKKWLQEPAKEA